MTLDRNGVGVLNDTTIRSLSEISDEEAIISVSIDLVSVARRHVAFLRTVAQSQWLHQTSTLLQSIRRYDELWMPLISDLVKVDSTQPILQPPLDIQWVWHCHTLNPVNYRQYCESRFSKILEKSMILDDENEEYALNRCRDVWSNRYPSEPFEIEPLSDFTEEIVTNEEVYAEVSKHKSLCYKFSEPYVSEIVYLIAAKQRYRGFMYLLQRCRDGCSRLVPTSDIQLMWMTHQSYPVKYANDVKEVEGYLGKLVDVWETVKDEDVEATKKLWEEMFDQPYEKAGATIDGLKLKQPISLEVCDVDDFNTKYKSMEPRFLLEVCIFARGMWETQEKNHDEFLRLQTVRCHRELKIDKPITSVPSYTWQKTWHLYCEFSTKGIILELRRHGGSWFKRNSSTQRVITFLWNDLLRAPSLSLGRELGEQVRVIASITPPIQVPYLLKCVSDRVTDDSGAMISDVILKMNRYRPQEGRWLSRTVLDHAGRGCFVVRIRVGGGIWRRGGETPVPVKWVDRIIEVREGSWSYLAGSIGRAPEKVVGTATPKEEELKGNKASWSLSTGDELAIHWDSSDLTFHLQNQSSLHSVRLLKGRKMQYQVNEIGSGSKQEEEEVEFVTLVRYTSENPNGRATALMNWRLLVVELMPDEDAVLVLLVCIAILRSVSEMEREDVGSLLVRRRLKEAKLGMRDWGSVILRPSTSSTSTDCSPHVQPWYLNAKAVMASLEADSPTRQSTFNYSPAEGGDKLYKRGILTKA